MLRKSLYRKDNFSEGLSDNASDASEVLEPQGKCPEGGGHARYQDTPPPQFPPPEISTCTTVYGETAPEIRPPYPLRSFTTLLAGLPSISSTR